MSTYTVYNLVLLLVICSISYFLVNGPDKWADTLLSARVGVLLVLFAYPWDFFALQMNVWNHPNDPGPRLFGVPFNDLFFFWICTFLTCNALLSAYRREAQRYRKPKGENARK